MKIIKTFFVLSFLFTVNSISAQVVYEKWPNLASLQKIITETVNPAEEGNLAPIKANLEELITKANALKKDIPKEYKTDAILQLAEKLAIKSNFINKLITEKAPKEIIVKSITDLHISFRKIVALCRAEEKE